MSPELLAWVIGVGNPVSALLTGPVLPRLVSAGRLSPGVCTFGQRTGWVLLVATQGTFLVFGLTTGLAGFTFAQPTLILVATLNFTLLLRTRGTRNDASLPLSGRVAGQPAAVPPPLAEARVARRR